MAQVLESHAEPLPPPAPDALPVGAAPAAGHVEQPVTPPSDQSVPPAEPARHTGWHIAAIVVGVLMLLPGFGAVAGGTALLIAQGTATDDGFFDVTLDRVSSDGVAITTVDLWDTAGDDERPWAMDWLDVDVRLWVDGAADTDQVFVGIARTEDVEAFLAGSAHTEVTGFDHRTPEYLERDGSAAVEPPTDVDIWDASASGRGEQMLTWEARNGDWSVVIMNRDGSPDVAADVEVGVRSGAITPIGIVLIVFGGVTMIAGTVLIVIGARGRRTTGPHTT